MRASFLRYETVCSDEDCEKGKRTGCGFKADGMVGNVGRVVVSALCVSVGGRRGVFAVCGWKEFM